MYSTIPPHSILAKIAITSDHLVTEELARVLHRATQTLRKAYSTTGHYLGIRPKKVGNRLLWPIDEVNTLLHGGVK
jgi:hypothetical protein